MAALFCVSGFAGCRERATTPSPAIFQQIQVDVALSGISDSLSPNRDGLGERR